MEKEGEAQERGSEGKTCYPGLPFLSAGSGDPVPIPRAQREGKAEPAWGQEEHWGRVPHFLKLPALGRKIAVCKVSY